MEKDSFIKLETKLDNSIYTHYKAKTSNPKDPYPWLEPDDPCRKNMLKRICNYYHREKSPYGLTVKIQNGVYS